MMININGKQFAKNDSEMIDTLFNGNATAIGFYKVGKNQINLMNHQKERIGVINRHGVLCKATKVDGGYWYSLATIDEIGKFESYTKGVNELNKIKGELL